MRKIMIRCSNHQTPWTLFLRKIKVFYWAKLGSEEFITSVTKIGVVVTFKNILLNSLKYVFLMFI